MFYIELFSALARHRVDYVLIGGLAVTLHGVERATMDIDVSVAMTPENLLALVATARELGMSPVLPVELDALGDVEQLARRHRERNLEVFALRVPGSGGVTLDVLLFPPVDFGGLLERALVFRVADVPVVVAGINDLIALKEAVGRPIDRSDVEHLKRLKEI